MPIQNQCLICAYPLKIPRRADARYCGSSCRVRAFRARRAVLARPDARRPASWRLPSSSVGAANTGTANQLALFRELRRARKRSTNLTAKVTETEKTAAQAQSAHDAQRRELQAELESTKQQLATEHRRTAELSVRLLDLERAAEAAVEIQAQTVAGLQTALALAEQKRADVDALRLAAEATAQAQRRSAEDVATQRDAEARRAGQLDEQLSFLRATAQTDRAESQRKLLATMEQAATALESVNTLHGRLAESASALQATRGELDRTRRELSETRAATSQLVEPSRLVMVEAELLTTREHLSLRTRERDEVVQAAVRLRQSFDATTKRLTAAEAELVSKSALIEELGPKLTKAYDQLLRIKEHKDWRL